MRVYLGVELGAGMIGWDRVGIFFIVGHVESRTYSIQIETVSNTKYTEQHAKSGSAKYGIYSTIYRVGHRMHSTASRVGDMKYRR